MFNKQLQEQVDHIEGTLEFHIRFFEAKIAKLERLIAESGLVAKHEDKDTSNTLYNLNGDFYTIKKGK